MFKHNLFNYTNLFSNSFSKILNKFNVVNIENNLNTNYVQNVKKSTWLSRITPDDITEKESVKLFENLRKSILRQDPPRIRRSPLGNKPQMKGIVLRTLVKKPKKPNSANRKCVYVRLSNGKEAAAFIPKEGHSLQEHHHVLVCLKRTKDVPGLRLRCIRGKYDLGHVYKEKN